MQIGYARSSVIEQSLPLQKEALRLAGCERIFTDEGFSGGSIHRPALERALGALKSGDVLIVWKLDRLGRSLSYLLQLTHQLNNRSIGLRSLSEPFDSTVASGASLRETVDTLVEFDRTLLLERTQTGRISAKQRGVKVGRKPKLTFDQINHAQKLIDAGESPRQVAHSMGVSMSTLYRKIPAAASNRNTLDLFANVEQ